MWQEEELKFEIHLSEGGRESLLRLTHLPSGVSVQEDSGESSRNTPMGERRMALLRSLEDLLSE